MRRRMAALAVAALPFTVLAAACDDDGDGNIDNPDLDPGEGTGVPGTAIDGG